MRKPGFIACLAILFLCSPFIGLSQNRQIRVREPQTRDKYVISAKAGGINAVTGRASVHGKGSSEWEQLTIKADLESGDVVKTDFDGRVEMLLNPGSYLRVGEDSEFELANNSLENLEVRLIRGTAIVEATGADDSELLINITTPDTKLAIVRRGLYRLNVIPGDGTELIVRKGRVMLSDSHTKVKDGNKVIFTSTGAPAIAKLQKADKKKVDNLDTWSKERAETVAKANRKMRGRDISLALASFSSFDNRWPGPFGRARVQGMWVFNGNFNCYTFVPFYGWRWGSPYGNSYSNGFYGCCGGRGYGSGGGNGIGWGGGGANAGGGGSNTGGGNSGGGRTLPPPPPPMSSPGSIPAAAQQKIDRLNDRMPNP